MKATDSPFRRMASVCALALTFMGVWRVSAAMLDGTVRLGDAPTEASQLRQHVTPWPDSASRDRLMQLASGSRFILLGEATHGTSEFYRDRAEITRALIQEQNAGLIVFEADWPSMSRVDQYVRGLGSDRTADEALQGFSRYPRWMWRNHEFLSFVQWLRDHNQGLPEQNRVRLIGMDLYSFIQSGDEAVQHMRDLSLPVTAAQARFRCFEQFRARPEAYGLHATRTGLGCEQHAEAQLTELRRLLTQDAVDGAVNPQLFSAFQNARIVKNAELYHRLDGVRSWNARDRHMVDTIDDAADHLIPAHRKVVVWAHNSHQGDARATSMGKEGQWNVGDLMRRRHGAQAVLVGFTTHTGTVFASRNWGEDGWVRDVRPSIRGSIERLFHDVGLPGFVIVFREAPATSALLADELWERAIGVQYLPDTERVSHYFKARVPQQFDAVIHIDTTRAVSPLEATVREER